MRLFVAVRFSPAVRSALLDGISALRRQGKGTFTRPENLHLTLAFIGETANAALAKVVLEQLHTTKPFSMTVGGLGHFDDLWWTGVRENGELETLALSVQSALRHAGFAIEKRRWRPHVTLVRRWQGPRPTVTVRETSMTVDRISLMESLRVDGKLVYKELYSRHL